MRAKVARQVPNCSCRVRILRERFPLWRDHSGEWGICEVPEAVPQDGLSPFWNPRLAYIRPRRGGCLYEVKSVLFPLGRAIAVRAFLTVIMGTMLLVGCAAKPTASSTQVVSAQEDKGGAPPELAASENYERAVADYNNCVLEHTSNLSACVKQQAVMNGLGKNSSRASLRQSYQTAPGFPKTTNTAGTTLGANTTNPTQAQVPGQIPQTAQATPSEPPARLPPQTPNATSSQMSAPMSLAPPPAKPQ